jgi:hypothetical protein
MKRLILALACVTCFTPIAFAANTPTTKPVDLEEQNRVLMRRVADLEKLNARLVEQLVEKERIIAAQQRILASTPQVVPAPWSAPPTITPRAAPDGSAMPRGSVPQQFNGSTFYLVPLAEQQIRAQVAPTMPTAPATPTQSLVPSK